SCAGGRIRFRQAGQAAGSEGGDLVGERSQRAGQSRPGRQGLGFRCAPCRGTDHAVHRAQGFDFYSSWSLWDVYRAQQPLMVLLDPARSTDFIRSLIAAGQASPFGILPVWAYQGLETWCMIGYHAVPVIADAYVKGV